jgi:hypothetical protein
MITAPGVDEVVDDWFDDMTSFANAIGFVGETIQTVSCTAQGTETFITTTKYTGTFISGARYRVSWNGSVYGSSTNAAAYLRLRYATGSTVTSTGTLVPGAMIPVGMVTTGAIYGGPALAGTFVAPSSGQFTVGASIQRYSGSGDVGMYSDNGSNGYGRIEVTCVKPA